MKYNTCLRIGIKSDPYSEYYLLLSSLYEGCSYLNSGVFLYNDDGSCICFTHILTDCAKIYNVIHDNLLFINNLNDLIDIIIIQNKELTIIQKEILLGKYIYYPLYRSSTMDSILPKIKQLFKSIKFYIEVQRY